MTILKKIGEILANWWGDFTLQTRLMAAATLVVSLVMSGLTFWAVNTIQVDARLNDTRYGRDLGLLLAANVAPLIAENNKTEVSRFSRQFYNRTSSIRYMLYADETGEIYLGIPFSDSAVKNSLTLQRRIQLPEAFTANIEAGNFSPFALVKQHSTPDGEVTDVFVPIVHEKKYLGVLALGINPNPTVVISSNLTRDVTLAVFVTIWVMVILGAVFNALTITQPIKELVFGVKNIASGNFKQRVDLPLGGELGELICSFNEMAEKLESYEEQNIEELTAEKAKLETLVSTIADGAILLDANLQLMLVNPNARRMFDWEEKNVIGSNVLLHLPPEVQLELGRPLKEIAKGDRDSDVFRCSLTEPINRTIRILVTTVILHKSPGEEPLCKSCIADQDNICQEINRPSAIECTSYQQNPEDNHDEDYRDSLKGIAMTIQDITREVELNEAKSQFISNVSHELRTPLFNIKSFIETLNEYGEELSLEERREFLETANKETDRLTRLVNDVLDLSRLESCRIYQFTGVDIAQAVEQTLRTYQLNAKDKGIELSQELPPDLPLVLGHYDLLLQVFGNLVGNALKFTSSGGKVMIRAYALPPEENLNDSEKPQLVRIEISDTGIGIDQEDQAAIFDRFFRVENRVHTLEGTGLGLSIVRNIMEKHHTSINLVSEVGVGTTFWFDLSVYQPKCVSTETPVIVNTKSEEVAGVR
jgi:two-component system sensor histidine kinase NblS